jgi:hypothetical protein
LEIQAETEWITLVCLSRTQLEAEFVQVNNELSAEGFPVSVGCAISDNTRPLIPAYFSLITASQGKKRTAMDVQTQSRRKRPARKSVPSTKEDQVSF